MADNRFPLSSGNMRETVCIDTNKVCDCCRDRDCFESARVYFPEYGYEILDRTGTVRPKSAEIVWTYIGMDPVPFNKGFYSINIKFYVRVVCEACTGGGPRSSQELIGLAILEKQVILYGGDSNANIYRSTTNSSFCPNPDNFVPGERNTPVAVCEAVDPLILGAKIVDCCDPCAKKCCCCGNEELPTPVLSSFEGVPLFDDNGRTRFLTVSLGLFSVVRIVRPAQYLVQAAEYIVPEKECISTGEDDPCSLFRAMPFPMAEFGSEKPAPSDRSPRCGCNS